MKRKEGAKRKRWGGRRGIGGGVEIAVGEEGLQRKAKEFCGKQGETWLQMLVGCFIDAESGGGVFALVSQAWGELVQERGELVISQERGEGEDYVRVRQRCVSGGV